MNIFKKEKKTLTDSHKRSIIKNEGNVGVMGFRKSVIRFFKTLVHTITKKFGGKIPFSIKKFFSRYLGGKVPMKSLKLKSSFGRRFAATFAVALVAIVLVACGGGGGGAPAVAPVAVVPPVVAAGTVTSVTGCIIPNGGSSCQPLLSWTTANATTPILKVGTTTVSTQAIGTNFATPAMSVGTYAVVLYHGATILDASRSVTVGCAVGSTVIGGVCAIQVVCVAPAMANSLNACVSPPAPAGYTWNTAMKAWVANIGTLVTGANTLPAACVTVGDACWLASVANGTVKLVSSGAVATGLNTRPIVFAFFVAGPGAGIFSGYYNVMPIYADVAAEAAGLNGNVGNGSGNYIITETKGSAPGAKQTIPGFGCFERAWFGAGFGNNVIACPI